jgi:MinD-like ATPase involved in chromosome partitioning or flagellar assembly
VSIHSFRGGTGKSNTAANLAALLALDGMAVAVVDTDLQSPGIHMLFGLEQATLSHTLNDYLWGACGVKQVAHDVTAVLGERTPGRVHLVPASARAGDIARIMRDGYDVDLLNEGFRKLVSELELDVLLIDTHPGINEETLLSIAVCHSLLIVMRPDRQDYEGTSVTVTIARKLAVPQMLIVVNKTPEVFPADEVRERVEHVYSCDVAAVLPHVEELMVLSSGGLFVVRYPDHPVTGLFRQVADRLMTHAEP